MMCSQCALPRVRGVWPSAEKVVMSVDENVAQC